MSFSKGNKINLRHGMDGTKVYNAWRNMKKRCYNPKNISYPKYGGIGIKVCEEWLNSFENFYKDMGLPPSEKHSLDRIKNELGYSKDNCRWATKKEQSLNRNPWKSKKSLTGYRGVAKFYNRFTAVIRHKLIGTYSTAEEAALAYNKKAIELFGDNAILNEVKDGRITEKSSRD